MTEKELVLCAQAGDVDAFCTLYDRYKRKLYNYAYYKLGMPRTRRTPCRIVCLPHMPG